MKFFFKAVNKINIPVIIWILILGSIVFVPSSYALSCPLSVQFGTSYSLEPSGSYEKTGPDAKYLSCDYEDPKAPKDELGYSTKWMTVKVTELTRPLDSASFIKFCTDAKVIQGNSAGFTHKKTYTHIFVAAAGVEPASIDSSFVQPFFALATNAIPCSDSVSPYPIIFLPGVGGTTLGYSGVGGAPVNLWPAPIGDTTLLFMDSNGEPVDPSVSEGTIFDFGPSATNFYGDFINKLDATEQYSLDTNLFTFPYDWRLYLDENIVNLSNEVNRIRSQTGSEKVILIAHSMGGVLAKSYAQDIGKDKVDMVITIGTPYFGAVKPFYALADGYNFGNPGFLPEFMKRMAQNSPGVYHLIAPYDFVFEGGVPIDRSTFLNNVKYAALDNVLLDTGRNSYAILNENTWAPNKFILNKIDDFNSKYFGTVSNPKPLPENIRHYVIVGTGVSTLGKYIVEDALEETESHVEFKGKKIILEPVFVDGDGTVPIDSSRFGPADKIYYVKHQSGNGAEHGNLPQNKQVQSIVLELIKGNEPTASPYSCTDMVVTSDDKSSNFMIPNYKFAGNPSYSNAYYSDSQGSSENCNPKNTSYHIDSKSKEIPSWIKNNAKWWADGQIDDDSFIQGIQFLVKEQIVVIPSTIQGDTSKSKEIPSWIKNNAKWWADGQIDDDSFIQGIQFLVKEGILQVN